MSAALSSTPRVSVCPRVVVRVGPIVCRLGLSRGSPLCLGTLVLWAAARCDVRCLAAASRACGVLRSPLVRRRALAVRGSGPMSRARSQPLLPVLPVGGPPPRPSPRRSLRAPVGEVPRRSRHAWTCPGGLVRVSRRSLVPDAVATHSGSLLEGQAQEYKVGNRVCIRAKGGKKGGLSTARRRPRCPRRRTP